MILGFRANINNDTDRIFLSRIKNSGILLNASKSKDDRYVYSFLITDERDLAKIREIRSKMVWRYENVPEV